MTATSSPADASEAPPLDLTGTRRAPRFTVPDGIEVQIDGKPATLVDISMVGAQFLSASRLRPGQRVRFSFDDEGKSVRVMSTVAWASFEIFKGSPRYRGAVDFLNGDTAAIERFIQSKRKK